jgi:DNA invertase Pin-like site-specific DNA recombinase
MATKRVAIYVRVSTNGQTVENQRRELEAVASRHGWTVAATFEDAGISGAKGRDARPGLDALMKVVARREVDIVAAWSVDRLGRSLQDLVALLGEIHAKHVDLYLHQQGIDTTTPAGKALFQMMGVFAEFEREMIRERVKSGLARAVESGTKSGNPIGRPRTSPKVEAAIRAARAADTSVGIIKLARQHNVGVSVVQRVLSQPSS